MERIRDFARYHLFSWAFTLWYRRNVHRYWEKVGETYSRERFKLQDSIQARLAVDFLVEKIAEFEPELALEVGCGYGRVLKPLIEKGIKVIGLDFSSTQLKGCKEYLPKDAQLIRADAKNLPFKDKTFDLSFTSGVVMHNPPKDANIIRCELIRVSKNFVLHNEDMRKTEYMWGYDNARIYRGMGFEIVENIDAPTVTGGRKCDYVLFECNLTMNNRDIGEN